MTVYGEDYATPDGTCIRDFIHVSDLADVLAVRALDVLSCELAEHRVVDHVESPSGSGGMAGLRWRTGQCASPSRQRSIPPSAGSPGRNTSAPSTEIFEHPQHFENWFYVDGWEGQGGSFNREDYIAIFRDLTVTENLDAWSAYHLGLQHLYRFNRVDNSAAAQRLGNAARNYTN